MKIGDKVKYDGSSYAANGVLIPHHVYEITGWSISQNDKMISLKGYDDDFCVFYWFNTRMFELANNVDYFDINKMFA